MHALELRQEAALEGGVAVGSVLRAHLAITC